MKRTDSKSVVKSVLIIGTFVGAVLLTGYQFFLPAKKSAYYDGTSNVAQFGWKIPTLKYLPSGQVIDTSAYSKLRDPNTTPRGLPVQLIIPSIGVDTAIEDAYITPDGRMDVPRGSINVAWYALGFRPGQEGSSVLGGHFGIDDGVPKVFYNLHKLTVGDKVFIIDDKNQTLTFQVRSIKVFGRNDDSTPVFISNDNKPHLNLITCEGEWNRVDDSYPDRRVVFTDMIPSESIPKPSLSEAANLDNASISAVADDTLPTVLQNVFTNFKNWFIYLTDF